MAKLTPYPRDFRVGTIPVRQVRLDGERIWGPEYLGTVLMGDGSLSAAVVLTSSAAAGFRGDGELTATASPVLTAAADLSGGGTLSASVTASFIRSAPLSGVGALGADTIRQFQRSAPLSGTGTLSASVDINNIITTAAAGFSATRTVTITFPGYVPRANDTLVLWPSCKTTNAPAVVPANWTNPRGGNVNVNSTLVTEFCIHRVVTAGEETAGTNTFTLTNFWNAVQTGDVIGLVARYVSVQLPVDDFSTALGSSQVNHSAAAFPAANVQFNNDLVVGGIARAVLGTYTGVTAGWTILLQSNNNQGRCLVRRNALTTAGVATAAGIATANTTDNWCSITLLLVQNFDGTYVPASLSGGGTLSATMMKVAPVAAGLSGGGTLSATAVSGAVSDDFNRPDAPDLGPGWVNHNGTMSIVGGMAKPNGLTTWNYASSTTLMTSDNAEASVTLGPWFAPHDHVLIYVGANDTGELIFAYFYNQNAYFWYQDSWASYSNISTQAMAYAQGDTLTLRRIGTVYTIFKNGVDTGYNTNTTLVPISASRRQVGFGLYTDNGTGYRMVDAFSARSL